MKMDFLERRQKIQKLAMEDFSYREACDGYKQEEVRFQKFVSKMPRRLLNLLRAYPGMGFFVYHELLNWVSEHMIFPDET